MRAIAFAIFVGAMIIESAIAKAASKSAGIPDRKAGEGAFWLICLSVFAVLIIIG